MSLLISGDLRLAKTSVAPQLIDTYPGAAAAYSLRSLSLAYGGTVVRVRRSSDNTEQDFTAAQVTDGTLAVFCGAGNGFVRTWYDQSGNSNNATQTDTIIQPQIVSSGSLVTHASKPAISFTGGLCRLNADSLVNKSRIDAYIVKNTADSDYILFSGAASAYSWVSVSGSSQTSDLRRSYGASSQLYANGVLFSGTTRGNIFTHLDGCKLEVHQQSQTLSPWSFFDIGCYNRSTSGDFVGSIQELVFYTFDQSSNRTAIESSINAHYAIY